MAESNLTRLLQETSRLAAEAADAAARGDVEAALRLEEAAENTGRRARRFGQQHERKAALLTRGPSGRQRAVMALTEIAVPSSPKEIVAYVAARTGEPFDVRTMTSIRRDERRSWGSGSHRETYIVPALEGPWLVAGRGRLGLSHWQLWRRIIGPLSPRADHLRACRSLVEHSERLLPVDAAAAERLRELLARYARSVPGALEQAWSSGAEVNPRRVLAAIETELELIGDEDERWRAQQGERALRQLTDEQRMWGATAPQVVDAGQET